MHNIKKVLSSFLLSCNYSMLHLVFCYFDILISVFKRSAKASDSSQLAGCMWSPPSPTEEVVEEDFVEVLVETNTAIPFFDHQDGKILIQGGTVVNDDGQEETDVLIDGGKIVEVGKDLEIPADGKVLKATGKFVVPGGIDSATHLHNPNNGNGELPQMIDDFETGSKAALLGGTTTVIDLVEPQKGKPCLWLSFKPFYHPRSIQNN